MKKLDRKVYTDYRKYPVRVAQFGENGFLRGFVDARIDRANREDGFDGGIAVIQLTERGRADRLAGQDGLFTVRIQGKAEASGDSVANCVSECVNPYRDYEAFLKLAEIPTLRLAVSYAAADDPFLGNILLQDKKLAKSCCIKLTSFLFHRFETFDGNPKKGLIVIPCEPAENNGKMQKKAILRYARHWNLGENFIEWVSSANVFCDSFADRIVVEESIGDAPNMSNEPGYEDEFAVDCEPFSFWAIKGPDRIRSEIPSCGAMPVEFLQNLAPYRECRSRILVAGYVLLSILFRLERSCCEPETLSDGKYGDFVRNMLKSEVLPTIDMPTKGLKKYADTALLRVDPIFAFQYNRTADQLVAGFTKYGLPSLLSFRRRFGQVPSRLSFMLAALIECCKGCPDNETADQLKFIKEAWKGYDGTKVEITCTAIAVLGNEKIWGYNLNTVRGLSDLTANDLFDIERIGIRKAVCKVFG